MTCANSPDISFRFNTDSGETYLEIRPRSMQYDQTRGKLDYCKAKFGQEIADVLQTELDKNVPGENDDLSDDESVLLQPVSVILRIKGENLFRLLWVPDGARFVENGVHVEFHDPQKYLTKGVIDWKQESVKIEDAYNYVFNNRDKSGPQIFKDIEFTNTENAFEELRVESPPLFLGINGRDAETTRLLEQQELDSEDVDGFNDREAAERKLEQKGVFNIIDSNYAVDFDKITPWQCLNQLNEKFAVDTWAGADGKLYVGERRATGYTHMAATDDNRIWKLNEYNTPAPRDPVVRSVIRGGWENDNDESWWENATEYADLSRKANQDLRIEAVAETKTNSVLGQEIFIEDVDAKKNSLEEIAKRRLKQKQRQQQNGHIDINPEISGTERTDPKYVRIGDALQTIPPDNDLNSGSVCDTNIGFELFDIVGIQHELTDDGNWRLRLDVVKKLDDELDPDKIETSLRYYDPYSEEYIEGDNYSNLVDKEGGFFDGLLGDDDTELFS